MKKLSSLFLLASLVLLAMVGCTGEEGSGNVIDETFDVGGFSQVSLNGIGDVFIEETGAESVVVTTDDNFLDGDNIRVAVENGTLFVETENVVNPAELTISITVNELERLEMDGVMEVRLLLDDEPDRRLEVEMDGGDVMATGAVEALEVWTTGIANFDGAQLESGTAAVHARDVSDALVKVDDGGTLAADTADTAAIRYIGEPAVEADTGEGGTVSPLN